MKNFNQTLFSILQISVIFFSSNSLISSIYSVNNVNSISSINSVNSVSSVRSISSNISVISVISINYYLCQPTSMINLKLKNSKFKYLLKYETIQTAILFFQAWIKAKLKEWLLFPFICCNHFLLHTKNRAWLAYTIVFTTTMSLTNLYSEKCQCFSRVKKRLQ